MLNIIDVLKQDHAAVLSLFDQLCSSKNDKSLNDQLTIFQNIQKELLIHTTFEEKTFYPLLKEDAETRSLILLAYQEHKLVDYLLAELKDLTPDQEEWLPKIKVLQTNVAHHIQIEEKEIFSKAKNILTKEELEELARVAQKFKIASMQKFSHTTSQTLDSLTEDDKSYIKTLNNLLEFLYDSMQGFQECADQIKEKKFKELFKELSTQRQEFINYLTEEISLTGESPAEMGHFIAAAHRLYTDLKILISNDNKEAVVKEIKRGEEVLLAQYEEALRDLSMPPELKALLQNQMKNIESNLTAIEEESNF